MGLPYSEEIMIVGRTMWTQSTSVTDRQTDGRTEKQTDRITITNIVQRMASHGKNDARNVTVMCAVTELQGQQRRLNVLLCTDRGQLSTLGLDIGADMKTAVR